MVIDDSILRSGIWVARLLGLGGMAPDGKWRQVAVMAPGAALAGVLSTALCLLPEEKTAHVAGLAGCRNPVAAGR